MFHLGERAGTLQITEWTVDYGVGLRRPLDAAQIRFDDFMKSENGQ